jgi:16S rRNA (uracil1498-N3)-methyltransferase
MASALAQSGGAWLPQQSSEASPEEALAALPVGTWLLLDPSGEPIVPVIERRLDVPVTIITGPEGGLEDEERDRLATRGAVSVSLATTILRFETAALAALAVVRAALAKREGWRPAGDDKLGGWRGN